MGDAITLVTYTYEVGSALVKRCQLVKQCHSESARIAMRTLRVLAQLDKAAASFSSPELDASLVELKDVLERAQDLVAKCQKVKGVSAKLGALVKANTLKGELVRVEADLDRVANDLQLPILTDIRRAVESIGERELEAGGGEGGTCAEELEQTVRAAIRKELETSAGGPDGRLVKEIIGEKLSQAYAGETPEPVPETPEPVGTGVLRCSGHGEECALRTVKKPGPTQGRKFYCCPRPRSEDCKMFAWADECDVERDSEGTGGTSGGGARGGGGRGRGRGRVCKTHKEPCAFFMVKKEGPNQGRYFYNCARRGAEQCSSFTWADDQPAPAPDPTPSTTVTTVTTTTGGGGSGGHGGTTTTTTTTTTTATGGRGAGGWSGSGDARVAAPGARNGRGGSGPVCKGHREPCRRLITKQGDNKGRPYYVCPRPSSEKCKHFRWADEG